MAGLMDEAKIIDSELKKIRNQQPTCSWPEAEEYYFKKVAKRQIIPLKKNGTHEMQWLSTLADANILIVKGGWLQISRWKDGKKILQLIEGIDAAYRMQQHILDRYLMGRRGEIAKINSLEDVVGQINLFLCNWAETKKQHRKNEVMNSIISVVLALERCQNFFKVDAHGQIEEVLFLEDGLQRENPGAMAAKTIASLNRLNDRRVEIEFIYPTIAFRKQILVLEIRRLQRRINKAKDKINFILRIKPAKDAENIYVNKVVNFIKEVEKNLTTIWVSPFRERKIQACEQLIKARKIIAYDHKKGIDCLENAREILKDRALKII